MLFTEAEDAAIECDLMQPSACSVHSCMLGIRAMWHIGLGAFMNQQQQESTCDACDIQSVKQRHTR